MWIEITAQVIGILAMIMNCLSYQQKGRNGILFFQLGGSILFSINFFMLGAISGAILNLVGIARVLVFLSKEKLNAKHPLWLALFITLYALSYVLIFTVFNTPFTLKNAILEILPVIAMTLTTISFRFSNAKAIRIFGIFNSPLWLIYNIFSFSIGAICSEIINLISIVVGIIRHDIKRENKEENYDNTNA